MKLYYWTGPDGITKSFGDELNQLIWPHYLPDAFDNDPAEKFIGIGTLLNKSVPLAQAECLVAEVKHGAIVADAMGITWITAIDKQNTDTLPFKRFDWCASVNVKYVPVFMTGVKELYLEHHQQPSEAEALKEVVKLFRKIEEKIKPVMSDRVHAEAQERKMEDVIMQFRKDYENAVNPL